MGLLPGDTPCCPKCGAKMAGRGIFWVCFNPICMFKMRGRGGKRR